MRQINPVSRERSERYSAPWALACTVILLALTGCKPTTKPPDTKPAYTGPTLKLSQLVGQINATTARLPTLWAGGTFDADVADPATPGRTQYVNGQIRLLYQEPMDLRLIGRKDIAGQVFDVASNKELYWLQVGGDVDTLWYGRHALADAADLRELPIRPDLLIDVLGVNRIDPDLLKPPLPVMRFNPDADAYMLTFDVRKSDHWAAEKEVWYDRQTLLPRLVLLFDADGRIVLRAYLSNPKPVDGTAAPDSAGPPAMLASTYQLYFPDTGSRLRIDLSDLALSRNRAPNAASFRFPGDKSGAKRAIDVDAPPPSQRPSR